MRPPQPPGRTFGALKLLARVCLLLVTLGNTTSASVPPVAKIVFDEAATIQSFRVDATVFAIPFAQIVDEGTSDFSRAGALGGVVTSGELGTIGKTATSTTSFGYFAAAAGFASADVWSEFEVLTPAIPDRVGEEDIDVVEIQIIGRIRAVDLDAAVCGAAWTAELTGVHFGPPGPPEANFEFPSVGCILPQGTILNKIDDILTAFDTIDKIEQVFGVGGVALGIWQPFVVRILLYDREVPRNQSLNLTVQLGRRVGSALAAGSVSGGEIDVSEIRVVGWAGIGPTVYLRTWHSYSQGQGSFERLTEVQEFDIRRAQHGIDPYPEVTITCPPYPLAPTQRIRGRIYTIEGDELWRLEFIELDGDPTIRLAIIGDTCSFPSFGPIVMDRSHRVVLGFEQGVADLVITGFRTVPPQPQRDQRFELHILVQNIGDLSTLEASRNVPLSGEFKFDITVGNAQTTLPEVRILQPGESWEFFGLSSTCNGAVEVTVDSDDEIDEGFSGELNNTASLSLPSCELPLPTNTRTPTPTRTPTETAIPTPHPARPLLARRPAR